MVRVRVRLESGLFKQAAFRNSLRRVVTRSAFALEADAKIRIQQGPKTGRVYRRGSIEKVVGARTAKQLGLSRGGTTRSGRQRFVVGSKFHRASAPGQSPASDTTNLANSIVAKPAQSDARGTHSLVTVNANYGAILEHSGGYIAKRPFIAPSIKKERPKFLAAVDQLLVVAVK